MPALMLAGTRDTDMETQCKAFRNTGKPGMKR